jgi:hypothetical protein
LNLDDPGFTFDWEFKVLRAGDIPSYKTSLKAGSFFEGEGGVVQERVGLSEGTGGVHIVVPPFLPSLAWDSISWGPATKGTKEILIEEMLREVKGDEILIFTVIMFFMGILITSPAYTPRPSQNKFNGMPCQNFFAGNQGVSSPISR